MSSLHCALPGIVESFDAEAGTAAVRPAVRYHRNGGVSLPLLRNVPVYLPEARVISPGANCLVVFADCDIDAWYESGEASAPVSGRQHDLSDAFAFVGFRDKPPEPPAPAPIDPSVIVDLIYPVGSIYTSVSSVSPEVLFGGTWEAIEGRFLLSRDTGHAAGTTGGAASVSYTPAGTNTGGSVSNHTLTTAQIPSHNHSFTGSAVTSGGINANHTHTGTSGNPSANHTHSGPSHNHSIYGKGSKAGTSGSITVMGSGSDYTQTRGCQADGTGATGTVSAWHTHTTTTGNQSAGHAHSVTAAGSIGNAGSGGAHNHGFTNPTFSGTVATIATMPPYLAVYMWKRTA